MVNIHDHGLQSRLKVAMLDNLLNVYSIIIVIIIACIGLGLTILHRWIWQLITFNWNIQPKMGISGEGRRNEKSLYIGLFCSFCRSNERVFMIPKIKISKINCKIKSMFKIISGLVTLRLYFSEKDHKQTFSPSCRNWTICTLYLQFNYRHLIGVEEDKYRSAEW